MEVEVVEKLDRGSMKCRYETNTFVPSFHLCLRGRRGGAVDAQLDAVHLHALHALSRALLAADLLCGVDVVAGALAHEARRRFRLVPRLYTK